MLNRPVIMIAAISARALTEAASRSGYCPLTVDFFGDHDTLGSAFSFEKLPGQVEAGFEGEILFAALQRMAAGAHSAPLGLVYGAGFEDRPELLARLAQGCNIIGNSAETIAACKTPERFAALLERLAIPAPRISNMGVSPPPGWLAKEAGGAGGAHIRPAANARQRCGTYVQEKVEGRAFSALFLAGGGGCLIIGFSEQWPAPLRDEPYRFGGAVQPAEISDARRAELASAIERLSAALRLSGLNSADFICADDAWWLLEINPRPGATLDLFDSGEARLLHRHVLAAGGFLSAPPAMTAATALAIVYADAGELIIGCDDGLPEWVKDRPVTGTAINANAPICTVLARAATANDAAMLCARRADDAKQFYYQHSEQQRT